MSHTIWICVIHLHWVYKTLGTPPICPQNSLSLSGHGTLQGVRSVPQGCWPMLTPVLPTVLDPHGKLLYVWKIQQRCSSWHQPVRLAPTTITPFKGSVLPIHPLNNTHTQSMSLIVSRLKNPSLNRLLPFIYTDWSGLNIVTSIRDHIFHLDSPGQSVMEGAGVPNILSTRWISVFQRSLLRRGRLITIPGTEWMEWQQAHGNFGNPGNYGNPGNHGNYVCLMCLIPFHWFRSIHYHEPRPPQLRYHQPPVPYFLPSTSPCPGDITLDVH
jgi:hypothetical protein